MPTNTHRKVESFWFDANGQIEYMYYDTGVLVGRFVTDGVTKSGTPIAFVRVTQMQKSIDFVRPLSKMLTPLASMLNGYVVEYGPLYHDLLEAILNWEAPDDLRMAVFTSAIMDTRDIDPHEVIEAGMKRADHVERLLEQCSWGRLFRSDLGYFSRGMTGVKARSIEDLQVRVNQSIQFHEGPLGAFVYGREADGVLASQMVMDRTVRDKVTPFTYTQNPAGLVLTDDELEGYKTFVRSMNKSPDYETGVVLGYYYGKYGVEKTRELMEFIERYSNMTGYGSYAWRFSISDVEHPQGKMTVEAAVEASKYIDDNPDMMLDWAMEFTL